MIFALEGLTVMQGEDVATDSVTVIIVAAGY